MVNFSGNVESEKLGWEIKKNETKRNKNRIKCNQITVQTFLLSFALAYPNILIIFLSMFGGGWNCAWKEKGNRNMHGIKIECV